MKIETYPIKAIISYSIILLVLSISNVFGQETLAPKKSNLKRAVELYGLLLGQEYELSVIKTKLPQLERDVTRTQFRFNGIFGNSKANVIQYLKSYLGEDKFKQLDVDSKIELAKMYMNIDINEEIATNALTEINKRSDGVIPLGILETLLSFQFLNKGYEEFTSGFTYTYKTRGHLKSKGTDWQFKIPKSWSSNEGNRPNIIQTFQSDYSAGNPNVVIMNINYPLSKGDNSKVKELSQKEMSEFIPKESKFIAFSKMKFDGNVGGMTIYEQIGESLDSKFKIRIAQFIFYRDGKLYSLAGSVSSLDYNLDLSIEMDRYLPLFKVIANSIVVNSQYK